MPVSSAMSSGGPVESQDAVASSGAVNARPATDDRQRLAQPERRGRQPGQRAVGGQRGSQDQTERR